MTIYLNIIIAFVLLLILFKLTGLFHKRQSERQPEIEERKHAIIEEMPDNLIINDAIAGLVSLGYKKQDAKGRVQKAWELLDDATAEQLIKKAMAI